MAINRISKVELRNWKNFLKVDVALQDRAFLIGPNAVGKSNFLDALRFLRDLVLPGGGLAKAIASRGGLPRLRSLHQKGKDSDVSIAVALLDEGKGTWRYALRFNQTRGQEFPHVTHEVVEFLRADAGASSATLLQRPDPADKKDPARLTQTALEQTIANKEFREIAQLLRKILYLHLVPQLIREMQHAPEHLLADDPLGRDLLDRMKATSARTRGSRLRKIAEALKIVSPQFDSLDLYDDRRGRPHLRVKFAHWRGHAANQDETQMSDGTLRLIGLLWAMQERSGPLLLEEPELSLHSGFMEQFAPLIHRAQRAAGGRQVILSTHSEHLLRDEGIGADEVLLVQPAEEGSEIVVGADVEAVAALMTAGIPASDAAYPRSTTARSAEFRSIRP